MKIAVFSDIHGNYINLVSFYESALKLGVNQFICLGDLCNYYPENKLVIDFIKQKKIRCVLGNHDELYIKDTGITEKKKAEYNFDKSLLDSKEHIDFLKTLPLKLEIIENNKNILFCHASPLDLLYEYIYPDTDLTKFDIIINDIVFIGHTHRQFIRKIGDKIICNVGSIGLPRDNGSLMSFATYDTNTSEIKLYRKEINCNLIKVKYESHVNKDVIDLLDREEQINYKYTLING